MARSQKRQDQTETKKMERKRRDVIGIRKETQSHTRHKLVTITIRSSAHHRAASASTAQHRTTQHNTTHQPWTPTCTPSLWRRRSRSRRVSTGKTTFSSVQRRYRRCNRNRNYKHNSNLHRRPPPPPRKPLPLPLPHPRHQHLTRHGLNASSISLILTLACVSLRRPSITDR